MVFFCFCKINKVDLSLGIVFAVNFLYRNLTAKQLVLIGTAIPLLCILLIVWLQWQAVTDMLQTRVLARHSHTVIGTLSNFRSSLSDAESCQLRYVLTHKDLNVAPYQKFLTEATDDFQQLRSLTADNALQQKYLDDIEPLMRKKTDIMSQTLALEQSGKHADALQLVSTQEDGSIMLTIENNIDEMQSIEAQVLFQRQTFYQRNFKIATVASFLGVLLCFCFFVAILVLLRRLSQLQSSVTLRALTEMIEYEGGQLTIEEYLNRRHEALQTHGQAQIEAERLLGLLEKKKLRAAAQRVV